MWLSDKDFISSMANDSVRDIDEPHSMQQSPCRSIGAVMLEILSVKLGLYRNSSIPSPGRTRKP